MLIFQKYDKVLANRDVLILKLNCLQHKRKQLSPWKKTQSRTLFLLFHIIIPLMQKATLTWKKVLRAFFNRADSCACHCRKGTGAINDINTVRLIVTTTPAQPNLAALCFPLSLDVFCYTFIKLDFLLLYRHCKQILLVLRVNGELR